MKKLFLILSIGCLIAGCGFFKKSAYRSDAQPITHELWTAVLKETVSEEGWIDYKKIIADRDQFDQYLDLLRSHHPNPDTWSEDERLAYWINAYNAFTVELILQNYPLQSIKDVKKGIPFVNGVWDIKFIDIEGQSYTLNNIEHGIIRPKFNDPRIHMAVNCASFSCPPLLPEAFTAERLQEQLDGVTKMFLKDDLRNAISSESVAISSIFKWYKGDFTKGQTLHQFLNKYLETPIAEDVQITYLDYDWSLNDIAIQ